MFWPDHYMVDPPEAFAEECPCANDQPCYLHGVDGPDDTPPDPDRFLTEEDFECEFIATS